MDNISVPEFKIRKYTKSELAELYKISTKTLATWVKKACEEDLKRIGYIKTQKYYSSTQVRIIIKHLGTP